MPTTGRAHTAPDGVAWRQADGPPLRQSDWIAGLEHGLRVLQAFDAEHPRLTATQAARHCGLSRTAARRLLLTLAYLGFVASDGKHFWPTPRVLRLGQSYRLSARLPRLLAPGLRRLASLTGGQARLCALDGDTLVVLACAGGPDDSVGTPLPARRHADGQLLLAQREQPAPPDWVLSDAAGVTGPRELAVLLRDAAGTVQASLCVTVPASDESAAAGTARLLPLLQATALAVRPRLVPGYS